MPVLATEALQTAMAGARSGETSGGGFGARRSDPLAALKSAISTAERENVVDGALIQEAKVVLATQPLRNAMERRDVAGLRVAIVAAEGKAEVDAALVKVSVGKRCLRSVTHVLYCQWHPTPPNMICLAPYLPHITSENTTTPHPVSTPPLPHVTPYHTCTVCRHHPT